MLSRRKHGLDIGVALFTIASNVSLRDFVFPIPALLSFAELIFPHPEETHFDDPTEAQVRVAAREP